LKRFLALFAARVGFGDLANFCSEIYIKFWANLFKCNLKFLLFSNLARQILAKICPEFIDKMRLSNFANLTFKFRVFPNKNVKIWPHFRPNFY